MNEYFFKETRLNFSVGSEFVVRLVTYCVYLALAVSAVLLLTSSSVSLFAAGILIAFFLIDRALHLQQGEKNVSELSNGGNLANTFTPSSYRVLFRAYRRSLATNSDFYIELMHELLQRHEVQETLRRLDVDADVFGKKVEGYRSNTTNKEAHLDRTERKHKLQEFLEELAKTAYVNAVATNERFIEPKDLFVAAAEHAESLIKLFDSFEINREHLSTVVIFGRWRSRFGGMRRLPASLGGFVHRPGVLRKRTMNRAWTARPTKLLDQYSTDLTELASHEKVGLLIGHEKEFEHLLNVLARSGKPNALLVGEPGVGKSTIIAHLAFRMIKDDVPKVLFDRRLISLDIASILADATPDVLAGRMNGVVKEILLAGNVVLFIPDMHYLFQTADKKSVNAIDLLLPVLRSGEIPVIGETYKSEFKSLIERRSDFLDQFEVVDVEQINEADAVKFLTYASLILEREHKVFITFRAIQKAVQIAKRYFANKMLPGSALDLIKQAIGKANAENIKTIDEKLLVGVAERQSKIPIEQAGEVEAEKLLNLESIIHERLVNQETAVIAVSRALREYRSGLSRKGGPIAAFLFVGPTGVGKTELAKILTKIQFGSKEAMHRFDMSEYQDKQSIFRFIGTPDGETSGALTDALLEKPYSLVLLDEFEKAHPDILNLFLQVFDDGRLTDGRGRTANFEHAIIIATSNAHSNFIKEQIENKATIASIAEALKKKLTEYFKPELLNRFSDIVVFRSLTMSEIATITTFLIHDVADTLKESHSIIFKIDESAVKRIAELGYDPVFGARPLRQVISEKIRGPLAEKILKKDISRGNSVYVGFDGKEFTWIINK